MGDRDGRPPPDRGPHMDPHERFDATPRHLLDELRAIAGDLGMPLQVALDAHNLYGVCLEATHTAKGRQSGRTLSFKQMRERMRPFGWSRQRTARARDLLAAAGRITVANDRGQPRGDGEAAHHWLNAVAPDSRRTGYLTQPVPCGSGDCASHGARACGQPATGYLTQPDRLSDATGRSSDATALPVKPADRATPERREKREKPPAGTRAREADRQRNGARPATIDERLADLAAHLLAGGLDRQRIHAQLDLYRKQWLAEARTFDPPALEGATNTPAGAEHTTRNHPPATATTDPPSAPPPGDDRPDPDASDDDHQEDTTP